MKKLQLILLSGLFTLLANQALYAQKGHYANLTTNIAWTGMYNISVTDMQTIFNNGRTQENIQLGTSLPSITFPSQLEWDAKTNSEKVLWIVNKEREDRGLIPWEAENANVTSVAQSYAQYMLDNDVFGHNYNGTPVSRLTAGVPGYSLCNNSALPAECIGQIGANGAGPSDLTRIVEVCIYMWIYQDAGSSWGHREMVFSITTDDGGQSGKEGLFGVGRIAGGPYRGSSYAEIVVVDFFDPCALWIYSTSAPSIVAENSKIDVFPNPVSETINLNFSDNKSENINISVLNLQGQLLYNVTQTSNELKIDVSSYPKGLYFVKVKSDENVITEKIIKN